MIKLKNVTKAYGKRKILDNFSYTFADSGLYVVVGESGAGKTTLLRIIAGLDKAFTGRITEGIRVSYAFQEHRLFDTLSALENVSLVSFSEPNAKTEAKARELLISLGLTEEELSLRPQELSGGMKQRVSIARALLREAPILILDEPTKELDRQNSELVLSLIEKEAEKRTVILVTHDSRALSLPAAKIIEIKNLH